MNDWKTTLAGIATDADRAFDGLKYRLLDRMRGNDPIIILNGRRIEQRSQITQQGGERWLDRHLRLNGFDPIASASSTVRPRRMVSTTPNCIQ